MLYLANLWSQPGAHFPSVVVGSETGRMLTPLYPHLAIVLMRDAKVKIHRHSRTTMSSSSGSRLRPSPVSGHQTHNELLRLLGWMSRMIPLTHSMTSGLKVCRPWSSFAKAKCDSRVLSAFLGGRPWNWIWITSRHPCGISWWSVHIRTAVGWSWYRRCLPLPDEVAHLEAHHAADHQSRTSRLNF